MALKHSEEPSYHLYSQHRGEGCVRWTLRELCQDKGNSAAPLSPEKLNVKSSELYFGFVEHFLIHHCFKKKKKRGGGGILSF